MFAEKKQQRLDIGNLRGIRPGVSLGSRLFASGPLLYDQEHKEKSLSYPSHTKAFLYYSIPPEKPRIAGELRLRVTSSDDVASFECGSDLLRSDGQLWSRPIHALSSYHRYLALYEKLKEDRFIPDDLDKILSTFPIKRHNYQRSHFFYTLNDTFIVDFSAKKFTLCVITEQGTESLTLVYVFSDFRIKFKGKRPYTGAYISVTVSQYFYIDYFHDFVGSALARFELSTLPDHEGTRTIVLRFLKIITPVKCVIPHYDGYVYCPKEGELHRRTRINGKENRHVWSVNIDEPRHVKGKQGLRFLLDA